MYIPTQSYILTNIVPTQWLIFAYNSSARESDAIVEPPGTHLVYGVQTGKAPIHVLKNVNGKWKLIKMN